PQARAARAVAGYDEIGTTYTNTRRADPHIAAAIRDALGDARSMANVGAGAGSYEPRDSIPELEAWSVEHYPSIDEIESEVGPLERRVLPIPRDCRDGFLAPSGVGRS